MGRFDPDDLVAQCLSAANEADSAGAVADVVEAVVRRYGPSIDDAFGRTPSFDPNTLYSSSALTVQRIAWPGGTASPPHEHRMWAVVGVYTGREFNTVFDRAEDRIRPDRTVVVESGAVLTLPATAVHEVRNPDRQWTAGLHVYGGDILNVERSSWLPDGVAAPQKDVTVQRRAMVAAMLDLAADLGRKITDDDRYVAYSALWEEVDRRQRNLTPDEARAVVAAAWGTPDPT